MQVFMGCCVCVVLLSYLKMRVIAAQRKRISQFIFNCELSRSMQELIGSYIMMEEYFMKEMVVKVTTSCQNSQKNINNCVCSGCRHGHIRRLISDVIHG